MMMGLKKVVLNQQILALYLFIFWPPCRWKCWGLNSAVGGKGKKSFRCVFAFLISSHRNPAIDCCKYPLILRRGPSPSDAFVWDVLWWMRVCFLGPPVEFLWLMYVCVQASVLVPLQRVAFCVMTALTLDLMSRKVASFSVGPGRLIRKHWSSLEQQHAYVGTEIAKSYWHTVWSYWIKSEDLLVVSTDQHHKVCVCVCACVFLYLLHIAYQNPHSTSKVRRFLESEDIFSGPNNYKDWGQNILGFIAEFGMAFRFG